MALSEREEMIDRVVRWAIDLGYVKITYGHGRTGQAVKVIVPLRGVAYIRDMFALISRSASYQRYRLGWNQPHRHREPRWVDGPHR